MSDDLRDRLAAAVRPFVDKGATWSKEQQAVDAVLAVVQPELDRFEEVRARHDGMILELRNYEARDERLKAERDAALATLARVRELHQPDPNPRSGWQSDDGGYGRIAVACRECGAVDMAVRWPCPTVQAIDAALAGPAGTAGTCSGWLSDVEHIEMTLPIGENAMGRLLADLIVAIQSKWDAEYGEPDAAMAADAALEWLEARTIEPAGPAGAGSTQDGAQ